MVFLVTETGEVARRYFSLQIFDGAMVGIGIIFGLHFSGAHSAGVIIQTLVSVMIAMVISGWTGALISERAEQEARIRRLELATLTELRRTLHGRVGSTAALLVALVNGLTPVAAVLTVSTPYVAGILLGFGRLQGLAGTVAVASVLLLAAGAMVGQSTGAGPLRWAAKMIGAGLAAALLVVIVEAIL